MAGRITPELARVLDACKAVAVDLAWANSPLEPGETGRCDRDKARFRVIERLGLDRDPKLKDVPPRWVVDCCAAAESRGDIAAEIFDCREAFAGATIQGSAFHERAIAALKALEAAAYRPSAAPQTKRVAKGKSSGRESGGHEECVVAALSLHHNYKGDGELELAPVTVAKLHEMAGVSQGYVVKFFKRKFTPGKSVYDAICGDTAKLLNSLRLLNGDVIPGMLHTHLKAEVEDDTADKD